MARMVPSNPNGLKTAGEKKLYTLFKNLLPPECVVRYEVLLGFKDRNPDFTIVDPRRGVCIVEIKDWGISNITSLTPDQAWVRGMGGSPAPKPFLNPNMKCQIYQGDLRGQLVAMPSLRDEKKHLAVPVDYFLIFPNIGRDEFVANHYNDVIPVERVIFREEVENNGQGFLARYEKSLPVLPEPLKHNQLEAITAAIDPTIVLPRPVMDEGLIASVQNKVSKHSQTTISLSLDQEEIAKSMGEGPRLLRGIAGTGKTIILLYRAKLLAANDPKMRILILCWNTALATYMKQAYDSFEIEAKGEVSIKHFSEFLRELFNLFFDLFTNWDDQTLNARLSGCKISEKDQYDAIYIDEAQDFRKEWIEFLFTKMVRGGDPKERNFIIAADDAQRIYTRRDFVWDSLDFKFTGRSKILKTIYRNSARIWIFSAFLLEEKASYIMEKESSDKLIFANKGEYEPYVLKCRDLEDQIERTVQIVQGMLQKGFAARNVLILYRHKTIPWQRGYPLVENLKLRLSEAGIVPDWISEDGLAKRTFDWDADTVKISTVQSAKGMDSPIVIILGAETFQHITRENEEEIDELKLLYVAMTRAREFLLVCYSGKGGLVSQLKNCEFEYEKYRDTIKTL